MLVPSTQFKISSWQIPEKYFSSLLLQYISCNLKSSPSHLHWTAWSSHEQLTFLLLYSLYLPLFPNLCPICVTAPVRELSYRYLFSWMTFLFTLPSLSSCSANWSFRSPPSKHCHLVQDVSSCLPSTWSTSSHHTTSRCNFSQHFSPHMPACLANLFIN